MLLQANIDEGDELFQKTSAQMAQTSVVARNDIAICQKVYQCSVADNRGPELAIEPPYTNGGTRTRREADPWWEVDLGKTQCIHSISFTIFGTIHQKLILYIMVLSGPVGFENPFLDKLITVSHEWKEYVFEECAAGQEHVGEWILPNEVFGGAIRFQIRGVQVLRLIKCKVFQGDALPPPDPIIATSAALKKLGIAAQHAIPYDEMVRITSFAAQPPSLIFSEINKEKERNKTSPPTSILNIDKKTREMVTIKRVNDLTVRHQFRKERINWWLDRARDSANFFTLDELVALRDIIFSPISFGPKTLGKRVAAKSIISTQELRGNSLIQHYPRCDLGELIKQIRKISEWIQTRQNTRDINCFLINREKFEILYADESDLFFRLDKVLQFMKVNNFH